MSIGLRIASQTESLSRSPNRYKPELFEFSNNLPEMTLVLPWNYQAPREEHHSRSYRELDLIRGRGSSAANLRRPSGILSSRSWCCFNATFCQWDALIRDHNIFFTRNHQWEPQNTDINFKLHMATLAPCLIDLLALMLIHFLSFILLAISALVPWLGIYELVLLLNSLLEDSAGLLLETTRPE